MFDPWQPEDPETEGTKPGLKQVLMDLRIWDARVAARRETAFVKTVEMPKEVTVSLVTSPKYLIAEA